MSSRSNIKLNVLKSEGLHFYSHANEQTDHLSLYLMILVLVNVLYVYNVLFMSLRHHSMMCLSKLLRGTPNMCTNTHTHSPPGSFRQVKSLCLNVWLACCCWLCPLVYIFMAARHNNCSFAYNQNSTTISVA